MKSKNTSVEQEDFDKIKALNAAGLPKTKICEITQRASGTVYDIVNSDSLDDYRELIRSRSQKHYEDKGKIHTVRENGRAKKIEQDEIDDVHKLKSMGVSNTVIAEIKNRHVSTIRDILKAKTVEDYTNIWKARRNKIHSSKPITPAKEETKQPEFVPVVDRKSTIELANESRAIDAIHKLATAVDRLADAMENDSEITKTAKEWSLFRR